MGHLFFREDSRLTLTNEYWTEVPGSPQKHVNTVNISGHLIGLKELIQTGGIRADKVENNKACFVKSSLKLFEDTLLNAVIMNESSILKIVWRVVLEVTSFIKGFLFCCACVSA